MTFRTKDDIIKETNISCPHA